MSNYFSTGDTPPILIARRGYGGQVPTGLGGVLDTIGDFAKNAASSVLSIYSSGQQAQGQAQAYAQMAAQQQQSQTPGWVLPVAAVAGVGVLALVLTRKRSNPARRRRR